MFIGSKEIKSTRDYKDEVELIEVTFNAKENRNEYRLSGKGVNFAVSMINLEHSERMLKYTKTIKTLTWVIVGVACLTLVTTALAIPFVQELILHGIRS